LEEKGFEDGGVVPMQEMRPHERRREAGQSLLEFPPVQAPKPLKVNSRIRRMMNIQGHPQKNPMLYVLRVYTPYSTDRPEKGLPKGI
jgi:hypothetical protein